MGPVLIVKVVEIETSTYFRLGWSALDGQCNSEYKAEVYVFKQHFRSHRS